MHSRYNALQNREIKDLHNKTAVVIGLGATGSVIAEHLARYGVKLCLVDRDYLEIKDLYTSNIYTKKQCKKALPKAIAAQKKLQGLTETKAVVKNVEQVSDIPESDIVIDGTDNIETRKIIDEASKNRNKPWIFSSALGERGISMFIDEACFNCMTQGLNPRDSCETYGVMREISSITASCSSLKAVDYLSGVNVEEKLELIPSMKSFTPKKCECSEERVFKTSNVCGDNKYQVFGDSKPEDIRGKTLAENKYLKRVEFNNSKLTLFKSGRAIIEAESQESAERLYREATSI